MVYIHSNKQLTVKNNMLELLLYCHLAKSKGTFYAIMDLAKERLFAF